MQNILTMLQPPFFVTTYVTTVHMFETTNNPSYKQRKLQHTGFSFHLTAQFYFLRSMPR